MLTSRPYIIIFYFIIQSSLQAQNLDWAKNVSGPINEDGNSVISDASGNVYVTGRFSGTIDADPSAGEALLTSKGDMDVFIAKYNYAGNYVWAIHLGGYDDDLGSEIKLDNDNNLIITGSYNGTVDFDPGPGIANLSATEDETSEVFMLKLDSAGNYIWVKGIGGISAFRGPDFDLDSAGYIYIVVYFIGTVDVDPSSESVYFTSNGAGDTYLAKYDAEGNYIWAIAFGGEDGDDPSDIILYKDNIYITGSYSPAVDFDPSPEIAELIFEDEDDYFIAKYDTSGNYIWAKAILCDGFINMNSLSCDPDGNINIAGGLYGTADFDPEPDLEFNLTSVGGYDICFAKYSQDGDLIWAKITGSEDYDVATFCTTDPLGYIYLTGYFGAETDFDPGVGIALEVPDGDDIFLAKYDVYGNFVSVITPDGTSYDCGKSICIDPFGNIYLTGFYQGIIDFDSSTEELILTSDGYWDLFLAKYVQDSCAFLSVSFDEYEDLSCSANGHAVISSHGGLPPYSYQWNTIPAEYDSVAEFNAAGMYTITIEDANNCITERTVLVNGPDTALLTGYDVNVNMVLEDFRSGTSSDINLYVTNAGCVPFTGTVSVVLDSLTHFYDAEPEPDIASGDTLTWNIIDIKYDLSFHAWIHVYTSASAMLGDTVCMNAYSPLTEEDADTANNIKQYCSPVVMSIDPNDKQVYPAGAGMVGEIMNNQTLSYTIRFQNTGNADAINIYILDTISANLDINSARIIASSDSLFTEVLPGNVLKFDFPGIYLPDSLHDEPNSHGYVVFEVDQIPDLSSGTEITNSSAIYFDFNEPVVTNSVLNTINLCLAFEAGIDSVNQPSCENLSNGSAHILAKNGAEPYNYVWTSDPPQYTATASGLLPGTYNVTVSDENGCSVTEHVVLEGNPVYEFFIDTAICDGDIFMLPDGDLTYLEGMYSSNLYSINGCDSIINTALTVFPEFEYTDSILLAADEIYELPDGVIIDGPGTYTSSFLSVHGCDSVITTIVNSADHIGETIATKITIQIIPNPNNGNFTMMTSEDYGSYDIRIYHANGSLMYSSFNIVNNGKLNIDTSLPSGLYFITVGNIIQISTVLMIVK